MMRSAAKRSQEITPVLFTQTRTFFAPQKVEFSDELSALKGPKVAGSVMSEWASKKASTEKLMKTMHTYKDIGDSHKEPYLAMHNPRTFEDMDAPIPNFKAEHLKPGEVPKFFDAVLSKRAHASVDKKNAWWAERQAKVNAAVAEKAFAPFPTLPVPTWSHGKPVTLDNMKKVTDAYMKAMEPSRKLKLPVMPAAVKDSLASYAKTLKQDSAVGELQEVLLKAMAERAVVEENSKPLTNFKYVSKAVAAEMVAKRVEEVHQRYLNYWAKKLLVSPELAVVPMKKVDAQLASTFETVSPEYQDLVQAVSLGPTTAGERALYDPTFDSFLLRREKHKVLTEDFPVTDLEKEAVALAKQYEDPVALLHSHLGPTATALGASDSMISAQIKEQTAQKFTEDRYFYKEGMKLAARVAAEEVALAQELKATYGDNADVKAFMRHPPTPLQALLDHVTSAPARVAALEAEKAKYPGNAYMAYALSKHAEFLSDPSNISFPEVLLPEEVEELMALELKELAETEAMIDEAEEEELWMYTLITQSKHIHQHYGNDLPGEVLQYMDPLTFKKFDYEVTNPKFTLREHEMDPHEQEVWANEALSHHFLPLIRYRRAKAKQLAQLYPPTM
jgi:hypothetical protein